MVRSLEKDTKTSQRHGNTDILSVNEQNCRNCDDEIQIRRTLREQNENRHSKNLCNTNSIDINIACINIRDLNIVKFDALSKEMDDNDIDIVCVTQTTLRGNLNRDGTIYNMIGKGRCRMVRRGGGVGVLTRNKSKVICEEIDLSENEFCEDLLAIKCQVACEKNIETFFLIVCYMTVEGINAHCENKAKYSALSKFINNKLRDERVVIAGDMNGHTGILGERINSNGQKLLDFADENSFEILNHTLSESRGVTWFNDKYESAIDYILVNESARNRVVEMSIDEEGIFDINTDHNVMVLKYKILNSKYNFQNKQSIQHQGDRWLFKDVDWNAFQVDLQELDMLYTNNIDNINENITKKVKDVAKIHIRKSKRGSRNKKKSWWNRYINEAKQERKLKNRRQRKLRKKKNNSTEDQTAFSTAWEEYTKSKKIFSDLIMREKISEDKKIISNIRAKGEEGGRDWYKFLRDESTIGDQKITEIIVENTIIAGEENIKQEIGRFWHQLCNSVRNVPLNPNLILPRKEIPNFNHEFSKTEIKAYLKNLKNNKAAGNDDIPYEIYKNGGEPIIEMLYNLYKSIWVNEKVPTYWNQIKVKLIHKGQYKSKKKLDSYRPIALADTIGKIFVGMINHRLRNLCETFDIFSEEQNGFRIDRRGEDNIYVVNEIIEMCIRTGRKGYIAFIDIRKAYDRVDRDCLFKVMEQLGIPEKFRNIIIDMYTNTKMKFILGDIQTEWVHCNRGVRQGCCLSPLLFSLYTEELIARVKSVNAGLQVGKDKLKILVYADDIVLFSDTNLGMQSLLNATTDYSVVFDVEFGIDKSNVLIVNGESEDDGDQWYLNNLILKRVYEYQYLSQSVFNVQFA